MIYKPTKELFISFFVYKVKVGCKLDKNADHISINLTG